MYLAQSETESRKDHEDVVDRHLSTSFETTNPNLFFLMLLLLLLGQCKNDLSCGIFWESNWIKGWWWTPWRLLGGFRYWTWRDCFGVFAGFSHSSCSCGSGESRNRVTCMECTGLFQISPEWVQQGSRSLATCIRLDSENRLISYHCTQHILQLGFKSSCFKVHLVLQKCIYILQWKILD